jgi:hypothetical protein
MSRYPKVGKSKSKSPAFIRDSWFFRPMLQPNHNCNWFEPGHLKSLAKNDTSTEETDPRHHLRSHPCGAAVVGKQTFQNDKTRRADRDQRIAPQAGHPLTPLTLESNACALRVATPRLMAACSIDAFTLKFLVDLLAVSPAPQS